MSWLANIAQAQVQLLEPIGTLGQEPSCFKEYIQSAFGIALGLAAAIAIIQFARGGFMYMMSEVVTNKSEAKSIMTSAIWGLILLLGAWIIIHEINPAILEASIFESCV